MYQVYKRKDTGEQLLAVKVRAQGKIKQVSKDGFVYSEYPSQVEVRCKELAVGDFVIMTEKGNQRVSAEEFAEHCVPQAMMIG